MADGSPFEAVIGLEVHAQLRTRSKIFCSCSTRFGDPPNSNTCPVCLGLPGALPVLNREALAMALKAALALGCRINRRSLFARKSYFYPDLPKGYQISQYDLPLAEEGSVEVLVQEPREGTEASWHSRRFGIERLHLEEDAGKSIHTPRGDTWVDLNRAGVPLIEIVSRPDFHSSREALMYLRNLRRILLYLGISDGSMEEGSLRCDANVSVRPRGSNHLGTKTEIKNLNSFRFLEKALEYEIDRQSRRLLEGGEVAQETRTWDEARQETVLMRRKEKAHDYRYFPEPDLLPLVVSEEWLEELEGRLPELPEVRRRRLMSEHDLGPREAWLVTQTPVLADYFETALACHPRPRSILYWVTGELAGRLRKEGAEVGDSRVPAARLARLVALVEEGRISGVMAKGILDRMCREGGDPEDLIESEGLGQISEESALEKLVAEVLEAHPAKVSEYRAGKRGLLGFFMGQVMRASGGRANPRRVSQILTRHLESDG